MKKALPAVLVAAVLAFAAGAYLFRPPTPTPPPQDRRDPIPPVVERDPAPPQPGKPFRIYRVKVNDGGARLTPVEVTLPAGAEPMAAALNAMAGGKDSPLPPGTRALSVKRDGSVARADFNKALKDNFPGGNEEEALVLGAILGTLGQFPGVESVQITVEGEKVASIGGHQDTTEPLPVRDYMVAAGGGGE